MLATAREQAGRSGKEVFFGRRREMVLEWFCMLKRGIELGMAVNAKKGGERRESGRDRQRRDNRPEQPELGRLVLPKPYETGYCTVQCSETSLLCLFCDIPCLARFQPGLPPPSPRCKCGAELGTRTRCLAGVQALVQPSLSHSCCCVILPCCLAGPSNQIPGLLPAICDLDAAFLVVPPFLFAVN